MDQVHRLGRGALDVVDDEHQRRARGVGGEEALERDEGARLELRRRLGQRLDDRRVGEGDAEELRDEVRDLDRARSGHQLGDGGGEARARRSRVHRLGQPEALAQQALERGEGRRARPARGGREHARAAGAELLGQLLDEARLADARRPGERDERDLAARRLRDHRRQPLELGLAADEARRLRVARRLFDQIVVVEQLGFVVGGIGVERRGNGLGVERRRHSVENRGCGVENRGCGAESGRCGVENRGRGVENRGCGVENRGRGVENRGYGVENRGCGVEKRGCGVENRGYGVENRGYGVEKRGCGVENRGYGVEKRRCGVENRGCGVENRGRGVENRGCGVENRGRGVENRGRGVENRGCGVEKRGCGVENRGCGVENRGPGVENRGYGVESRRHGVRSRRRHQLAAAGRTLERTIDGCPACATRRRQLGSAAFAARRTRLVGICAGGAVHGDGFQVSAHDGRTARVRESDAASIDLAGSPLGRRASPRPDCRPTSPWPLESDS